MRRCRPLFLLTLTLPFAGSQPATAQSYSASVGLGFSYSDLDTTAAPPAHVDGDTSPGSEWIRYDVTAHPGALETSHDLYSCCVNNGNATASFRFNDLIFASPGGTGGTADVTFNFDASGAANFDGSSLTVKASVGGGTVNLGAWIAGPTPASSGVFTGYNGQSFSGSFTSTVFTVALDVPLSFFVQASGGTGSYQVVSSVDGTLTLPLPGSGTPVFNILTGPAGITVNSLQGDIVDNQWGGGGVVAVEPQAPGRTDIRLGRPAPNPSRGAVSLALSLPEEAWVSLQVFDVRGAMVQHLEDGRFTPGSHRVVWTPATGLPAGTYFVRLRALGEERTQRVVVVR